MTRLTKRQNEVLELIQDQMELTGAPPTRVEIAKRMGFRSPNAAEDHLRALARKGIIELVPGTSRGIRLLAEHNGIPIVGKVAAGKPILSEEHIDDSCKIDRSMFQPKADFFLKVCGESMKNIGIHDQDLLAVHATSEVKTGQIVVARIDNEVTVKRFYRNDYLVSLKPENEDFATIEVDLRKQSLMIEGVGVGVIKRIN